MTGGGTVTVQASDLSNDTGSPLKPVIRNNHRNTLSKNKTDQVIPNNYPFLVRRDSKLDAETGSTLNKQE